MSTSLRVIKVLVQPVCVVDDGDTLTEVEVGAIEVRYAAWDTFDLHAALAPLRAQAEGPPASDVDV